MEIHELVGDDNTYIFGEKSEQVIEHYAKADYVSKDFYEKSNVIKTAVDFITNEDVLKIGNEERLTNKHHAFPLRLILVIFKHLILCSNIIFKVQKCHKPVLQG